MSEVQNDCDYIAHDNGIHEFIMHVASRKAVDIQLDLTMKLIHESVTDHSIMMLTDLRESGIPPLRYAMMKAKDSTNKYFKSHMQPEEQHKLFIAYILASNSLLHTFKLFIEQMARGHTKLKFFDNREDAEAWLLGHYELER